MEFDPATLERVFWGVVAAVVGALVWIGSET